MPAPAARGWKAAVRDRPDFRGNRSFRVVTNALAVSLNPRHRPLMARLIRKWLSPMVMTAFLTSCDPGINLAWETKLDAPIDRSCVQSAVKSVTGKISLSTYVSDGRPFPKGLTVYQIWYDEPFNEKFAHASFGYRIDIAPMPDGSTGYYHGWSKLGTNIPSQERDYVVPVMTRVNAAVAKQCGLSVGNGNPTESYG